MNVPIIMSTKNKKWFRRFFFYALPVSLKLADLALTIYLLRFPWNYESNPVAFWIIQRGLIFSFGVFLSLSLLSGAILNYLSKRLFDPNVKKNVKVLCGVSLFYNYFLLAYPVVNNVFIATYTQNVK